MSLPTMLNVSERSGRNGSNFPSAALNPPDNNENSVRPNPTLALTRALYDQIRVTTLYTLRGNPTSPLSATHPPLQFFLKLYSMLCSMLFSF